MTSKMQHPSKTMSSSDVCDLNNNHFLLLLILVAAEVVWFSAILSLIFNFSAFVYEPWMNIYHLTVSKQRLLEGTLPESYIPMLL